MLLNRPILDTAYKTNYLFVVDLRLVMLDWKFLMEWNASDLIWFDPGLGHSIPGEILECHRSANVITVQTVINGKVGGKHYKINKINLWFVCGRAQKCLIQTFFSKSISAVLKLSPQTKNAAKRTGVQVIRVIYSKHKKKITHIFQFNEHNPPLYGIKLRLRFHHFLSLFSIRNT